MQLRPVLGRVVDQEVDVLVRVVRRGRSARFRDELLVAAGREVEALWRQLRCDFEGDELPVGAAVPTPAGQLPADWLVHLVAPTYSLREERGHLLGSSYRACLRAADEVGARTLALSPLGMSYPYWPLDDALRSCLATLRGTPTGVREVRLVLATPAAVERFAEALARR